MSDASVQQNLYLESWLVGGLISHSEIIGEVLDILSPEDLFQSQERAALRALSDLYQAGKAIEVGLLYDHLSVNYSETNIQFATLVEWATESVGTESAILAWAEKVKEYSLTRQAFHQLTSAASKLRDKDGTLTRDDTLDTLESALSALRSDHDVAQTQSSMLDALKAAVEKIDTLFSDAGGTLLGLSSGFEELDKLTYGFQPGQLTLLAARPSMGKTAMSLNLLVNAMEYKGDKAAVYFSMEQPTDQLMQRLLAYAGLIDLGRVSNGQLEDADWPKLTAGTHRLRDLNIHFDDAARLTPAQVRSRLKRYENKHGELGLVIIDYLGQMRFPGLETKETAEVTAISRELKAMAKEFKCPVIALSQLNRSLESRANKRPLPSDLRQSGSLEQDADLILFLYRDEVYDEESPDKGIAEVIVSKNRNGKQGTVRLGWQGKYQQFYDLKAGRASD